MTEPTWLTEMRARCDAATPGPWHVGDRGIGYDVHQGPPPADCYAGPDCPPITNGGYRDVIERRPDATFIAASRTDLPAVLALVERLAAALEGIASWGEGSVVNSTFDEPASAQVARDALAAWQAGPQR